MTCEKANPELVESARGRGIPNDDLKAHLASCEACRDRWDAERELTTHLRAMRIAGVPPSIEWSKAVLMREFDANRRRERQVRWMWAMSSAAILVLSVVAVRDVWVRPVADRNVTVVRTQTYTPREYPREEFAPAEEAGEKGFIKLPFAIDPAPGETFEIVRTQLDPAQLTRMGVSVDSSLTGTVQADLMVGEDGLAQAVRLSNDDAGY